MADLKFISAEEAAAYINDRDLIGFSGFTAAGCPKEIPNAIAKRAEAFHAEGKEFKVGIYTGASTGASLDGALANADAVLFRTPYQSSPDLRKSINSGKAPYFDKHLSELAQELRYGFLPKPKFAIMEVCDMTDDGELIPTTGVGIGPTVVQLADYILIEWNQYNPKELRGFHDIYQPQDPPCRKEIPLYKPSDRIGTPYIKVDPSKIIGIVKTNRPADVSAFAPNDEVTEKIGDNVAHFLVSEIKAGRIPKEFLPIQSGVGNIANAVLDSLSKNPDIPAFEMYTEVIQDAVIKSIKEGNIKFASGCSLTVSNPVMDDIFSDLDFFRDKIVLRPQEISNNPELVRRMGLITINTALEADIFGNVNSTHVLGTKMMNGLGGSGDFTRNAYISIFTTPSTAKGGLISAFVPMVSHVDHSEHSVKVIITEHGIADLRGKSPLQRAETIIENCVAPEYKQALTDYLALTKNAHTPHSLENCFNMHLQFAKTGDMRNVEWKK